jgi:hypothetical protein
MNFLFVAFFALSFPVFAGPREEAEAIILRFNQETDDSVRLELISRIFLNYPYGKGGPLGEGENGKYDQDPLYRFDTFDCTTYVETIMALALSRSTDEFEDLLKNIRYENGEIDYLKRNHFTDLQWIPANIENGVFSELTYDVGSQADVLIAEALINFPGWLLSHKVEQLKVPSASNQELEVLLRELKEESRNFRAQTAKVPYLSINELLQRPDLLEKIPSGTVVNFVRPNWDLTSSAGTHQNISHQGFLFRIKGSLYLRHASTTGKVEELPLAEYLKRFLNHPTLKGIHLLKIN